MMETKDIIIIIAALGWLWAIVQFFINRNNQKKDKLEDRRYDAYSKYMTKSDELMIGMRNNPDNILNTYTNLMNDIFNSKDDALPNFFLKLQESTKKSIEPLLILQQELSELRLVCSSNLKLILDEMIHLSKDFNQEFQNFLNVISIDKSKELTEMAETIEHDSRWRKFEDLNNKVLLLMRKEIGIK